jgi:hypothetical protein
MLVPRRTFEAKPLLWSRRQPSNEFYCFPGQFARLGDRGRYQRLAHRRKSSCGLDQSDPQSRNAGVQGLRFHRRPQHGGDERDYPPLRSRALGRPPASRQPGATSPAEESSRRARTADGSSRLRLWQRQPYSVRSFFRPGVVRAWFAVGTKPGDPAWFRFRSCFTAWFPDGFGGGLRAAFDVDTRFGAGRFGRRIVGRPFRIAVLDILRVVHFGDRRRGSSSSSSAQGEKFRKTVNGRRLAKPLCRGISQGPVALFAPLGLEYGSLTVMAR